MKVAAIVTCLLGLAAASIYIDSTPGFRPGKEYVFTLESQALTGVPHLASQFSGIKIKANVRVQISNGFRAILKVEDAQILSVNDKLPAIPNVDILPDEVFVPLGAEQMEVYTSCLNEPVKFRYEQGFVSRVEVAEHEPEWCVNMKKGMMSLLQLNMRQERMLPDVEPHVIDTVFQNKVSWDSNYDKAYRVMEEAVDGDCESIYVVKEPLATVPHKSTPMLTLYKVRNYDNCEFRPIHEEGPFSSYIVHTKNVHTKPEFVKSFNHMTYVLLGDRTNFVISEMKQVATEIITPLSQEAGEIAAFVIQKLKLREVKDSVTMLAMPVGTRSVPEGLKLTFSAKLENPAIIDSYHYTRSTIDEAKINVIDSVIGQIATSYVEGITIATPVLVRKLMYLLRTCTSEELITIITKLHASVGDGYGVEYKKYKVILDTLPTVGTPNILPAIKKLIAEDMISPVVASVVINTIALTIIPTKEVVTFFSPSSEIYQLPAVTASYQLREAIISSFGTVTYGFIKAAKTHHVPKHVVEIIKQKVVRELTELYTNSPFAVDKPAVFAAITNCGMPEFLPFVQRLVEDPTTPKPFRTAAIIATKRMPKQLARKISTVLLPIFLNANEDADVRIVAFRGIMFTEPSYGILQVIVHHLRKEKCLNVGSYVYSHLTAIAESTRDSIVHVRNAVRILIKQVKPFIPRRITSKSYMVDAISKDFKLGVTMDINMIGSHSNVFPKGLFSIFGGKVMNKEVDILETGAYFHGLENIVSKLVGPHSITRKIIEEDIEISNYIIELIKELVIPSDTPDMGKIEAIIQNVVQKLGLTERAISEIEIKSYIAILGNHIRSITITPQTILNIIRHGETSIIEKVVKVINVLKDGYKLDHVHTLSSESVLMIPTPLGIPLYFNASYTHALHIGGAIKTEGDLLTLITRPEPISVDVKIVPKMVAEMRASVGFVLPLIRSGIAIKGHISATVPVHIQAKYDPTQMDVAIKYFLHDQPTEAIKVEVIPITYIHKLLPVPTTEVYEAFEKIIINTDIVKPVVVKLPINIARHGVHFENVFELPTPLASWTPYKPLSGKATYILNYVPDTTGEKVVELNVIIPVTTVPSNYRSGYRYHVPHYADIENKFETVIPDPSLTKPIIDYNVIFAIKSYNLPKDYAMFGKVTVLTDTTYIKYQCNVQFLEEIFHYKVMSDVVVDLTPVVVPTTIIKHGEVVAKWIVGYGTQNFNDHMIIVKVVTGDKNTEMIIPAEPYYMNILRNFFSLDVIEIAGAIHGHAYSSSPVKHSLSSWIFGADSYASEIMSGFIENTYFGKKYERAMIPITKEFPDAYKFTFEVEYNSIPTEHMEIIQRICHFIFVNYQVSAPSASAHTGADLIVVRIIPSLEKIHVVAKIHGGDYVIFRPFRLPETVKHAYTLYSTYLVPAITGPHYTDSAMPISTYKGVCTVQNDATIGTPVVTTFDQVTYKMPEIPEGCQTVLAKDCSPHHLFTIFTSKKAGVNAIHVVVPNNEIQVVVKGGWNPEIKVKVNGNEVFVPVGETKTVTLQLAGSSKSIEVAIVKTAKLVSIKCHPLGVDVHVTMNSISVHTSPLLSGLTCGLCSNFDGDTVREFTGPDMKIYSKPVQMVLSYVVPSATCDVAKLYGQHDIHVHPAESCTTVARTIVRTPKENGGEQVCLSTVPVKVCPTHCKPTKEISDYIGFHCLPANSFTTRRFVEESKIRPLFEMSSRHADIYKKVKIHKECAPIY